MKKEIEEIVQTNPLTMKELESAIKDIDEEKMAEELLNWLIANVEDYVDNAENFYLVYFTSDILEESKLVEMMKLQKLYERIPDMREDDKDDEKQEMIGKMMNMLDEKIEKAKNAMASNEEANKMLFERLIYFYEMVGFSRLTGPVIKKFKGYVNFITFIYESISIPVTVTKKMNKLVDGELVDTDIPEEVVNEFDVPEGFCVEFELIKEPLG